MSTAVKNYAIPAALIAVGIVAFVAGWYPWAEIEQMLIRVGPVVGFATAMTIVATLADAGGVFSALARALTRVGASDPRVFYLVFCLVTIVSTVFFSLDTTVVLMVPIAVATALRLGVSARPFAYATIWLANTASLLLPISNLTNLLVADQHAGTSPLQFAAQMWPAWIVSCVVPAAILFVLEYRTLHPREQHVDSHAEKQIEKMEKREGNRGVIALSIIVLVILCVALVCGVTPWIAGSVAALALLIIVGVASSTDLPKHLVPVKLVLQMLGIFLATGALISVAGNMINDFTPTFPGFLGAEAKALQGLVGANLVNNLPAYLALENTVSDPQSLFALLVGVNVGPLITPWASLATLLWSQRLQADGQRVHWLRFILLGFVVAPLTTVLAVAVL
ncbi:ArsB/NhaD family transporter [Gleimia hominis]|uniref:ArsB/NhaD family transporter n=1 Tax=Gleimia hominis TaxID=595468 RepID=A0ABU3I999_9ACTO|nr:SLC13 family permease [Gleimia hominis]MDT3766947.1 ArsB/NhaD family transporter [Gleimia hominis]